MRAYWADCPQCPVHVQVVLKATRPTANVVLKALTEQHRKESPDCQSGSLLLPMVAAKSPRAAYMRQYQRTRRAAAGHMRTL